MPPPASSLLLLLLRSGFLLGCSSDWSQARPRNRTDAGRLHPDSIGTAAPEVSSNPLTRSDRFRGCQHRARQRRQRGGPVAFVYGHRESFAQYLSYRTNDQNSGYPGSAINGAGDCNSPAPREPSRSRPAAVTQSRQVAMVRWRARNVFAGSVFKFPSFLDVLSIVVTLDAFGVGAYDVYSLRLCVGCCVLFAGCLRLLVAVVCWVQTAMFSVFCYLVSVCPRSLGVL